MYLFIKRLLDILISASLLAFLSPLLLGIVLCIVFSMGRPVFFTQRRPGWHGKPFNLVKFRTMRHAVGANGQPLSDAERLTHFGKWLRKTSLDELPELWNVLKGDMSLVGPRPLLMEYLPQYNAVELRRHEMRPGITGWAQINGRNAIEWENKFKLDVWYVDHASWWLDIRILFLTPFSVLKSEGINQPGQATAEKFKRDR